MRLTVYMQYFDRVLWADWARVTGCSRYFGVSMAWLPLLATLLVVVGRATADLVVVESGGRCRARLSCV